MIEVRQKGDFRKLSSFLEKGKETFNLGILNRYGREGVIALQNATPKDTGETASSWSYQISRKNGIVSLEFHNSHYNKGVPIAIILQYGHATGNGGYVQGVDYINPALQPIFNKLAEEAWREVSK